MKRKLFTFALLTTMVAGGATLSANAELLYAHNSNTPIECELGGLATCAAKLFVEEDAIVYTRPENDPLGQIGSEVSVEDYNYSAD